MHRRRWLFYLVWRALCHRPGKTVLLLLVLALASSLVTALGIVSFSIDKRVAEEIRNYGANLIVLPHEARLDIGSGRFGFGAVTEPVYLQQQEVQSALDRSKVKADSSMHLRGALHRRDTMIPVEGVDFAAIRRLCPWWQVAGNWPSGCEAVVGTDLATRLKLKPGDMVHFSEAGGTVRVAGTVATGGEEDGIMYLPLSDLQRMLGREGEISQARLLVTAGEGGLKENASTLQSLMPQAVVKEVRQVARTSEALLAKVRLLLLLVAGVVLVCGFSSVSGTVSTTILERRGEIALMKALGGTRREVVLVFAIESIVLGIAGGIAGYVLGSGIAQFITRVVFSVSAEMIPAFAVVSVAASLSLGVVGSAGPLLSVFRLDPAKSLRGE